MTRVFRSIVLFLFAGFAGGTLAGCSPLGPTSSPEVLPNANLMVENFSGALPLKGFKFYSFSVTERGTSYLSLITLKEAGVDSDVLVTIGIGTPRGTSCITNTILAVKADGSLSLAYTTERGIYCAVIYDTGNLKSDATFSMNITHPR